MKKKSVPLLFLEIVNPVAFLCLCCGGGWQRLSLGASEFMLSESLRTRRRKGACLLGMSSDPLSLLAFVGVLRKSCRAAGVTHRQLTEGRQEANSPSTTGKYRVSPVRTRKRRRCHAVTCLSACLVCLSQGEKNR